MKKKRKELIYQKVTKSVIAKLVSWGFGKKAAVGFATTITSFILNYIDPGTAIANYLDKKDGEKDGWISV